ncbi:MAG: sulfotransferase [Chitinophagaceae bacterium]|nr:sulfotransferase [Chitinophagaceae bacterium]
MTRPNFFIVGAPKCGTTAMDNYLKQHPDIFMAKKELHYFGSDLPMKNRIKESEYLEHFKHSNDKKIIGESSVWYLYSRMAAKEIHEFAPDAKILIMLRNPVTLLPSLHSERIYNGNDDVSDFETAINLDEDRKKGLRQPVCADYNMLPPYKETGLFYEQVKRYTNLFGRANVHIIIFEELIKNPTLYTKQVFKFLELNEDVPLICDKINAGKKIRNLWLHRIIKTPGLVVKKIIRLLIPSKSLRHRIMSTLLKKNTNIESKRNLNEQLNDRLYAYYQNDINLLETLIGRNLYGWYSPTRNIYASND